MMFFLKWLYGGDTEEKKDKQQLGQKFAPEHYGTFDGKPEHWYTSKKHMITDLRAAGFGFGLDKLKILEDDIDVKTNQWWYYIL